MNPRNFLRICTGILFSVVAGGLFALDEEALAALKHNPFHIPPFIQAPVAPTSAETASKDMAVRGVLISAQGTLVNINGYIVGLNQFIDDYKLVSLDDGQAVLSNNEHQIVLPFPTTSDALGGNRLQHSRPGQ